MKLLRIAGFTMIELLIVISILGVLAVAVLSAINPVEQINRGRDTGGQSDAEQLINAIDRYNAFQTNYPFQKDPTATAVVAWTKVDTSWAVNGLTPSCAVLTRLGSTVSTVADCVNSNEIKSSFTKRIVDPAYNSLYVYNEGGTGDTTYICFKPQSDAFKTKAAARCTSAPDDYPSSTTAGAGACTSGSEYFCLP